MMPHRRHHQGELPAEHPAEIVRIHGTQEMTRGSGWMKT